MESTHFISNVGADGHSTWTLTTRLGEVLHEVESLYGARDPSYTVLGVEFGPGVPMTWYPGNRRHIAIRLASNALFDTRIACYQLAHECVHLLSPSGGAQAPVLEEGLATVFSEDYVLRVFNRINMTSAGSPYAPCAALVRQLLTLEPEAIKKLRAVEPAFFKITSETFKAAGITAPDELIASLLTPFSNVPS